MIAKTDERETSGVVSVSRRGFVKTGGALLVSLAFHFDSPHERKPPKIQLPLIQPRLRLGLRFAVTTRLWREPEEQKRVLESPVITRRQSPRN